MKQWMLLGLLWLGAVAQAHDVWVAAPKHQPAGQILHADLGYSHDFPNVEKNRRRPRAYFQTAAIDRQLKENR